MLWPETLKLRKKEVGCFAFFLLGIILVVISVRLPPGTPPQSPESEGMVKARSIGVALWQYAKDHADKYPEGKTSTEVFQQLLDGKYVSDPVIFYYPLPGKVKPDTVTLKPENVSWDVTCCIDATSPDDMPVVFLAGYNVVYQAGAKAVPFKQPVSRTWSDWWSNTPTPIDFTVVCYKNLSVQALKNPNPDGSFPNFIPVDFDAKGKSYRQLTPEEQ